MSFGQSTAEREGGVGGIAIAVPSSGVAMVIAWCSYGDSSMAMGDATDFRGCWGLGSAESGTRYIVLGIASVLDL